MTTSHTAFSTLGDLPVEITFTYQKGSPATRIDPADPDEFGITSVSTIDGKLLSDRPDEHFSEKVLTAWETEISEDFDEEDEEEEEEDEDNEDEN